MKKSRHGLVIYWANLNTNLELPYADLGIKAGFPSPAQDYIDSSIDLNKELIKHPASTFYARVVGDSMVNADIYDGDILVIDRSLKPQDSDVAVCFIDGEFTVKRIRIEDDVIWLIPANEAYQPIKVTAENELLIWGIVTYSIKVHRRK